MKLIKLVIFSLLPAVVLFLLIEGSAQLYWLYREFRATDAVAANGAKMLKNDAINFLKEPDGALGYRLRANLRGNLVSNSRGLAQREEVPYARANGSLRITCIGESSTMGHSTTANYPTQLRMFLKSAVGTAYPGGTEVINGGVAGWLSDQWAIYSERELYKYTPDVVVFYAGWNDFQSYDPFGPPPFESAFQKMYGGPAPVVHGLKSIVLARAWIDRKIRYRRARQNIASLSWEPFHGARLERRGGTESLRAYLPPSSHISTLVFPAHFDKIGSSKYELALQFKGDENSVINVRGYGSHTDFSFASCRVPAAPDWSVTTCQFSKPDDGLGLAVLISTKRGSATLDLRSLTLERRSSDGAKHLVAAWAPNLVRPTARATYRFFIESLNKSVRAFKSANPNVKIVISSLVGRWPMDTEEQFLSRFGHVWWMENRGVGRHQAAHLLVDLNSEIEKYARENGFVFVDMARVFESLDRQKLMRDFVHMSEEGYRIMALVLYRNMRKAGLLDGPEAPELDTLISKYRVASPH